MDDVRFEQLEPGDAGVLAITLDRASKRNALTPGMLQAITKSVSEIGVAEETRAILLRGEGPFFCAGFDMALCRDDPDAMARLLTALAETAQALRAAQAPVVCCAAGGAIAGGCALACACDFVVADAGARFGYPVVRLGVSPAVSAPALEAKIGPGHARERLLDPGLIGAAEAHHVGLVSHLTRTPADAHTHADELARTLAAKPPHALRVTKDWLNQLDGSLDTARSEQALRASLSITGSADERERIEALFPNGGNPA